MPILVREQTKLERIWEFLTGKPVEKVTVVYHGDAESPPVVCIKGESFTWFQVGPEWGWRAVWTDLGLLGHAREPEPGVGTYSRFKLIGPYEVDEVSLDQNFGHTEIVDWRHSGGRLNVSLVSDEMAATAVESGATEVRGEFEVIVNP